MPDYIVKATVSVDVEITLPAETEAEARSIFYDRLIMTAGLVDMPDGAVWSVDEDSISDISRLEVVRA